MTTEQIDARIKAKQDYRTNLLQRREQAVAQYQQLQQFILQIERDVLGCDAVLAELAELRDTKPDATPDA